jgi:hypothetical protein
MLVRKLRRRVSGCFLCVVSCGSALLCGSLPRRRVLWRFLCVVFWESAQLYVFVPRRRILWRFSCVVSCVVLCRNRFPNATHGFVMFSLRRVLLWCEIAPLSCRDAKFLFVFPASRYYMGLFCSEMEHDAKFCADFFASCPVCMIW